MVRGRVAVRSLIAAIGLGYGGAAGAQTASGTAAAEALFQEGRALLMAGKADQACPKLEESQRLDPATGTLLAVALCHEQQGRLASAWAEFADVEARSRRDERPDRARTAREHGAALRPRLSTLTLEVPTDVADLPGLVIAIDGVPIGRAAWDAAIPVDGGERVVTATVPDGPPWKTTVSVAREQDHVRVPVPASRRPADPIVTPAAVPVAAAVAHPNQQAPAAGGARRTLAFVLLATGVAGLGAAAIVGLDARSDYRAAVAMCTGGLCPPDPYDRAQDAQHQGNVATVIAVGGATAALAGVALWLWPADGGSGSAAASGGRHIVVTPGGLSLSGSF
jgi:serine/threonine-protein kinase